jgi:ubiquitin-protein ligase
VQFTLTVKDLPDILQNQWSPIYDVAAILTVQSLLSRPQPQLPQANNEASKIYSEDRREWPIGE